MISLNPITDCELDLGLLNSLFKSALVSFNVARGLSEQYSMYQVSEQSRKVVINCTFFILSLVICCVSHITFETNHNNSTSSRPIPLKINIFITFAMLNSGGGGGGVDEGLCSGGGGGGVL